jgi:hypothetical protein
MSPNLKPERQEMIKDEANKEMYRIYIAINIQNTGEDAEKYILQINRPTEIPLNGMIKW